MISIAARLFAAFHDIGVDVREWNPKIKSEGWQRAGREAQRLIDAETKKLRAALTEISKGGEHSDESVRIAEDALK